MEDTTTTTPDSQPKDETAPAEVKKPPPPQPNPILVQALNNINNSLRENTAALVGLGVITKRLEDKIELLLRKGA